MAGNWNRIGNISGRDGKGVPEGGVKDDVLVKVGGSDFATGWSKLDYSQIAGKVPAEALPQISVEPYVVDSQEAMLNLPAVPGRMAIRTDVGKTFVLAEEPASTLASWVELKTSSDVTSVNDKVGAVVLTKSDVGLSEVDNTADADKPLATDTVRGLMSPSDRKVLYSRSSSPVKKPLGAAYGTAVEMDMFGRFEINEPYYANNPASKGYVDGIVSRGGSSTGQLTTGPDLNTLTSPGVFNVGRETLNTPVVAGFYSSCRVEVDVIHSSFYGTNRTVFQTARANAWDTRGPTVASAFTGSHKNELMASQTFKRESPDGGSTWTDWRAEGTTPWFPMSIRTGSGTHSNNFFYGIETGPGSGYPNVSSIYGNGAQWRINNGMVQLIFMFVSPQAGSGEGLIGVVSPTLRPPSWGPEWYSAHGLTHAYREFINGIVSVNTSGAMNFRTVGAYGFEGTTASKVDGSNLTWPVQVTSYTI